MHSSILNQNPSKHIFYQNLHLAPSCTHGTKFKKMKKDEDIGSLKDKEYIKMIKNLTKEVLDRYDINNINKD